MKYDYGFARACDGQGRLDALFYALASNLEQLFAELVCKFKGHNLEVDFHDPENGREDIGCKRCGWCETVYF